MHVINLCVVVIITTIPIIFTALGSACLDLTCGWEGNRRSGVALASQTLVVLHLQAQGLGEGDEHPPTLS